MKSGAARLLRALVRRGLRADALPAAAALVAVLDDPGTDAANRTRGPLAGEGRRRFRAASPDTSGLG